MAPRSIAGQAPDQTRLTLDGSDAGSGVVPREAVRAVNLLTSTYDVARGGFTGGQLDIQTLRGAPVRDALAWAKYLQQTIELYGDGLEVKFQAHHWPMWGQKNVRDYLESVPGWDKRPPAPPLPAEVVERTAAKYREALLRLTGRTLAP